jgi:thiamine biosynthesis protein ThiS
MTEPQAMWITLNGQPRQIAEAATIADLLAELGLSPAMVAVEVNLDLVPRGRHAERQLAPGDTLEVVSLVGGG